MSRRESAIRDALQKIESDKILSIRAAAEFYGIPESTFRHRQRGGENHEDGHEPPQRLSNQQEEHLAKWILRLDFGGYPPSHAHAREMAVQILKLNSDHALLGKKWLSNFMQRNPEVFICIGRSIEASRIDGTHPDLLSEFYTHFRELQSRYNVEQRNIWNMDEHGIVLGVCANSMVLASSGKKSTYVKSPQS
ncbi:hypothetical protein K3495_g4787 [Podosphaera aphanis]|nr:hypothetical protein K3495_g4787 [Podosphaera aphanis]